MARDANQRLTARRLAAGAPRAAASLAARGVALKLGVVGAGVLVLSLLLVGMVVALVAPAPPAGACGGDGATLELNANGIPKQLVPLYEKAAAKYALGERGPAILAAINKVETDFGRLQAPGVKSGANPWGASGPMQFGTGGAAGNTWGAYGVDGNGDGKKDVYDPEDAIPAAARYLKALGAPGDWYRAIFGYNHADWYVRKILAIADGYGDAVKSDGDPDAAAGSCTGDGVETDVKGVKKVTGGGRIVPIPGEPGESIDSRILEDVIWMKKRYKIDITDGYASSGHASNGEHPIGLAIDAGPGPGGSWDDVDRLAKWAEPHQNAPRAPFRWIGYDGDANHGRGNHIHISWQHGGRRGPPAGWVLKLALGSPRD